MIINISLETNEFTDADKAVLRAIAGEQPAGVVVHMADAKAAQQEADPEPAEAPEKPRRTRKAAAPKAPEPEPEEDLLGTEEPTLDTAVARAQALVKEGKGKAIKAALADVGCDLVRNLTDEQVPEFLAALEDA